MAKKKVKMLVGMASTDWSYVPQEEVSVESSVAESWVENGIAEYVTAAIKPQETAAKRKPSTRKKG